MYRLCQQNRLFFLHFVCRSSFYSRTMAYVFHVGNWRYFIGCYSRPQNHTTFAFNNNISDNWYTRGNLFSYSSRFPNSSRYFGGFNFWKIETG